MRESPMDILRDALAERRSDSATVEGYERRLARAVWLDRAEVLETLEIGAFGGTGAETDGPGSWAR
jgi:hypothetical protein